MKAKKKLIRQYAYAVAIFVVVTMAVSAVVTYFAQMKQYRELAKDRIRAVGDQLVADLLEDPQDFLDHIEYYKEHYGELRIPCDFTEYVTARDEFFSSFRSEYHDKTFRTDVSLEELPDWLQNLYHTYRHEYWILVFEKAREVYGLPYTYFLTCDDDSHYTTYMIDGERTEDKEHPGYLYMGDSYYEEPSEHTLLWNTYHNGVRYNDVYEWDNKWGNTYSCYTPLVIDGECVGLVVTEIDVADVNEMILKNTLLLVLQLGVLLVILSAALLFFINKYHIKRIDHLSEQISDFASTRAYDTVDAIRQYPYGEDEIHVLAVNTADMIRELQIHEGKIAQAAQFKSDFLANMSHEIRTPMNAIVGLSEMAGKEEDPDKKKEYISQINSSANAMLVIINDILDFTKIEAGRVEIIPSDYDVKAMIKEIVRVTSIGIGGRPVQMNLNISPNIPQFLRGDSARIRQILSNVIGNAVKFTKEGSVTINLDFDPVSEDEINLKIRVADTGIGIMKQDYDVIFESFSQIDSKRNRETEGTGLGLAITQRLVALMNGTIEVESEYGVGSVFRITIPQTIADVSEETAAEETGKLHAPNAAILVVDDNSVNLFVAKSLLGMFDVEPTCVSSGEDAIKACEKRSYDMILMDHMMPKMDGVEAMHIIREQFPAYKNIPIIAFTANAVEEARDLLLKEGMDDFLAKPVKGADIEDILRKWLPKEKIQLS